MIDERTVAIKRYLEYWNGRGYKEGETQKFWLTFLRDVLGIKNPEMHIEFKRCVKSGDRVGFIDCFIPSTNVLIEQISCDKGLKDVQKQESGEMLTPYEQAKRNIPDLALSEHPRWLIVCNFQTFWIYDMEYPWNAPEEFKLMDLENNPNKFDFLVNIKDLSEGSTQDEVKVVETPKVEEKVVETPKKVEEVKPKVDKAKLEAPVKTDKVKSGGIANPLKELNKVASSLKKDKDEVKEVASKPKKKDPEESVESKLSKLYFDMFKKYALGNEYFSSNFTEPKSESSSWLDFETEIESTYLRVYRLLDKNALGIEFTIVNNAEFYNYLVKYSEDIEEFVKTKLFWRELNTNNTCGVGLAVGVVLEDKDDWEAQFKWLMIHLMRFKVVFNEYYGTFMKR